MSKFEESHTLNDGGINHVIMSRLVDVNICHPGLCNLTLEKGHNFCNDLNVVAPQLKNLFIRDWSVVHLLSAPKLDSVVFKGSHFLRFSPNALCSLEKAELCIYRQYYEEDILNERDAYKVVDQLQPVVSNI